MKQLPLPAHPVFPARLDSIAALPELLRSRQIGCVLVIGDAHAVDCESLLLPVLEDSQIMYAVHAAVSLSDSKDGALTRTDVDTALQAFTDKQAQAILVAGGNDAMALGQALLARLHTKGHAETFEQWRAIPLILLPAAADAHHLDAPAQGAAHHGADGGVHTRRVAAGGQYTNAFHCVFHIALPLTF